MPTQIGGKPAVIQNSLPAAINISSTSNHTPVVVTTTTAHGLKTGDYFAVVGADEPALNGVLLQAGTVTSNTVVALVAPLGTNTVGTLAGGANGTVRALGFGTTYAIPSDGDKPNAASVNVPFQALADRTAWLEFRGLVRTTGTVPAVNTTIATTQDVWKCSAPLAPLTHTVDDATAQGWQMTIWRGSAGAFDITLQRVDTSVIATLPIGTQSAVTLTYYASSGWEVTGGYAFV